MRRYDLMRGVATTGALLLLASGGVLASPGTPAPENSLMGVPLMANYREVLHKYGQPQEIQVGGGSGVPAGGMGGAQSGPSGMRGMMPGMGGPAGMRGMIPGAGGPPAGLPGFPGGAGGMAGGKFGMMGARPGMGGPPGAGGPPGMPGMGGPEGGRGMIPGGGGPPAGLPGFPGGAGGMAGGKAGMFGGNAGGGNASQGTEQQETTWWYHFPQKGLHVAFLFNHEGRVIQIQEYGWKGGTRTRQGIGLGSTLGQLIQRYGWSNDGEHANLGGHEMVTMRYGGNHKLAFQLVDNKVVGITLGAVH